MKKLLSTVSLLFLLLCCNGQLDKFKKNNIQNNQYWDSIKCPPLLGQVF